MENPMSVMAICLFAFLFGIYVIMPIGVTWANAQRGKHYCPCRKNKPS